ncbi:MBOAT-domain-containing protein [Rhizoclosmatium globosum]|uniref:MBOAT-domain-containing protein n=1 Tax=Rhizoclosmatium globosum TaxID=329046 RepID=A0A1Y2CZJ9_9FUNG|nr:MBOAT-domain-containing protein [Rhizoclosmatium globosum]|eukprot:ORY52449.1 MBOAT-domain-containing protein [Rhizoclosmatium globosum]
MSALENLLEAAAKQLSMPTDVLKGGFILTAAYPLCIFYALIPANARTLRHIFSILASCTLYLSLFSLSGFIELMAMCCIVYFGVYAFKSNSWMPVIMFYYVLGHFCVRLFIVQILSDSAKKFDATTPMMVLVIKLTSFAWNVYDGTKDDKDVIPELRSRAIRKYPGFLEFFGYVFFFAAFLVGPAFDFNDYREYTNGEGVFSTVTEKGQKKNMPSRVWPTLKCLLGGIACMGIFIKFSKSYDYSVCATEAFATEWPFWKRFLFMQAAGLAARSKFYTAWLLSEGACNLVGIGYSGISPKTNKPVWERACNVSILGFELAENPKVLIDNWNMRTGFWLKSCVYLRMVKPGQKPGTLVTVTTFLVSALWHGFHLGYYLTFSMGALYSMVGRTLRRNVRPLFIEPSKWAPYKPIYDFLGWFMTWTSINFIAAPFALWALDKSLAAWYAVGFYSLIGQIVIYVGMEFLGGAKFARSLWKTTGALSRAVSEDAIARVDEDEKKRK